MWMDLLSAFLSKLEGYDWIAESKFIHIPVDEIVNGFNLLSIFLS